MSKLFNGGHEPLVPAGRWGQGVVMPGEWVITDDPSTWPPPWTLNKSHAEAAARAYAEATATYPPSRTPRRTPQAPDTPAISDTHEQEQS